MFFKLSSRNPFRDLLRNAKRVALMSLSDTDKMQAYAELQKLLSPRLSETERFLNNQTAFCKRAEHWNARDVYSIRAVTNLKNPWLAFKREFEQAIKDKNPKAIETSLAWFYNNPHIDDWVND